MITPDNSFADVSGVQPMTVNRTVASLPVRTAGQTWQAVCDFLLATFSERKCPTDRIETALGHLRRLPETLLTRHCLEDGSLTIDCGDLQIVVSFLYGLPAETEDLSLPPVMALEPLPAEPAITLSFAVNQPLSDTYLHNLITEVNSEGVLTVELTGGEAEPPGHQEQPADETDSQADSTDSEQQGDDHGDDNPHAYDGGSERGGPVDDMGGQ